MAGHRQLLRFLLEGFSINLQVAALAMVLSLVRGLAGPIGEMKTIKTTIPTLPDESTYQSFPELPDGAKRRSES